MRAQHPRVLLLPCPARPSPRRVLRLPGRQRRHDRRASAASGEHPLLRGRHRMLV